MRSKLQKTGRELKKAHGQQKRLRGQMDDLEEEHKKGLPKETYEERKAKLDARRHELLDRIKALEEQERRLEGELKAAKAGA